MKLYLVQHGKAMERTENPDRPLAEEGRREVRAMAAFLSGKGLRVPELYRSGKVRARETAEGLLSILEGSPTVTVRDDIDPKDDVSAFARELGEREEDLMVVGHLPFLSRLVSLLIATDVAGQEVASVSPLKTAAYAWSGL